MNETGKALLDRTKLTLDDLENTIYFAGMKGDGKPPKKLQDKIAELQSLVEEILKLLGGYIEGYEKPEVYEYPKPKRTAAGDVGKKSTARLRLSPQQVEAAKLIFGDDWTEKNLLDSPLSEAMLKAAVKRIEALNLSPQDRQSMCTFAGGPWCEGQKVIGADQHYFGSKAHDIQQRVEGLGNQGFGKFFDVQAAAEGQKAAEDAEYWRRLRQSLGYASYWETEADDE